MHTSPQGKRIKTTYKINNLSKAQLYGLLTFKKDVKIKEYC